MDQKINLDEIINKMNEKYPECKLTEFEKSRYLYIELGKLLSFNINYILGDGTKSEDIYWEPVDFDNISKNEYICRQIADMYGELLKRAGIGAKPEWRLREWDIREFLTDDDMTHRHKFTIVKLKDGRNFVADLVFDMPFIQKGMEPLFFGKVAYPLFEHENLLIIDPEEIREADKKIGYTYPIDLYETEFAYYDSFIQMIKEDMNNEEHLRDYVAVQFSEEEAQNVRNNSLIKYKFDIICKFFDITKLGHREGRMALEKVLGDFFTEDERKTISMHDLITEHDKQDEDGNCIGTTTSMIKCFTWKKGSNDFEYYIYEKGKNLRKIDKEEFLELIKKERYKNEDVKNNRIPGIEDTDDGSR